MKKIEISEVVQNLFTSLLSILMYSKFTESYLAREIVSTINVVILVWINQKK